MRKFGSLVNNMKRVLNNAVVQFLLGQCDNKYSTAYNFVQNIKKANYIITWFRIFTTWRFTVLGSLFQFASLQDIYFMNLKTHLLTFPCLVKNPNHLSPNLKRFSNQVTVSLKQNGVGVCVCILQGHGMHGHGETVHIPFPFDQEDLKGGERVFAWGYEIF